MHVKVRVGPYTTIFGEMTIRRKSPSANVHSAKWLFGEMRLQRNFTSATQNGFGEMGFGEVDFDENFGYPIGQSSHGC
ncbi:unnamed protein product [Rhizophagus irregularis]|nr:unnamed protein product [Rhizophagus irregularis]